MFSCDGGRLLFVNGGKLTAICSLVGIGPFVSAGLDIVRSPVLVAEVLCGFLLFVDLVFLRSLPDGGSHAVDTVLLGGGPPAKVKASRGQVYMISYKF